VKSIERENASLPAFCIPEWIARKRIEEKEGKNSNSTFFLQLLDLGGGEEFKRAAVNTLK